jgi:hypothetical protein
MLGEVLPRQHVLNDFEVEQEFESIGRRTMQLNARILERGGDRAGLILLAIEDITDRKRTQEVLREGEARKQVEEQVRQRQAELAHMLRITTVGELASGGLTHQPLSAIANGVEACARHIRSVRHNQEAPELLQDASSEACAPPRSLSTCAALFGRRTAVRANHLGERPCRAAFDAPRDRPKAGYASSERGRAAAAVRADRIRRAGHGELAAERHRRRARSPSRSEEVNSVRGR